VIYENRRSLRNIRCRYWPPTGERLQLSLIVIAAVLGFQPAGCSIVDAPSIALRITGNPRHPLSRAVLIPPEMNVIRNDCWQGVSRLQMSFRAGSVASALCSHSSRMLLMGICLENRGSSPPTRPHRTPVIFVYVALTGKKNRSPNFRPPWWKCFYDTLSSREVLRLPLTDHLSTHNLFQLNRLWRIG